jgi:hypothetical protein
MKGLLGRPCVDGRIILKLFLRAWECGLGLTGSIQNSPMGQWLAVVKPALTVSFHKMRSINPLKTELV